MLDRIVCERDGTHGATVVTRAPEQTMIGGEIIREAREGSTWVECDDRSDGSTVLRFGTEGRGLGVVEYRLTGWYRLTGDMWAACRLDAEPSETLIEVPA